MKKQIFIIAHVRDRITLEGLMLLIHYCAAVAGVEIKAFLSERSSPANLVPYKSLPMLRNSFSKEVNMDCLYIICSLAKQNYTPQLY